MFIHFFQEKNAYFRPIEEDYSIYTDISKSDLESTNLYKS
jgi:hypothetical protein